MSCHHIGYALNNIAKEIIAFYDNGKINKEDTLYLLKKTRDSISFCDGNSDEATKCLENRCSICLEQKENLINYNKIYNKDEKIQKYLEKHAYRKLLTDTICLDCLEKELKGENL